MYLPTYSIFTLDQIDDHLLCISLYFYDLSFLQIFNMLSYDLKTDNILISTDMICTNLLVRDCHFFELCSIFHCITLPLLLLWYISAVFPYCLFRCYSSLYSCFTARVILGVLNINLNDVSDASCDLSGITVAKVRFDS